MALFSAFIMAGEDQRINSRVLKTLTLSEGNTDMENQIEYPITGTCQCGNIKYEVTEPFLFQSLCHCQDCQKMSGTSFSISAITKTESFRIIKGELKSWTKLTEAGSKGVCYFCPTCSNRIYHQNPAMPEIIRLKPGTLDDTSIINPQGHYWTCRKQSWIKIPDDLPQHATQPS